MALPDGDIIRSQLTDVSEDKYFIDETWLDETRVKVEHRIEESGPDQSTLIYAISALAAGEGFRRGRQRGLPGSDGGTG
jgi:hypothetical protein